MVQKGKGGQKIFVELHIKKLRLCGLMLFCLVVGGTVGYIFIEGMTPINAFYMTIITLSTVGFGEVEPLNVAGRIFTVLLILSGVGIALWSLSTAAELLLSEQIWHLWRRRRMGRQIAKMQGHYIICGYGRMGRQVVSDFYRHGVLVVVVEGDPKVAEELQRKGVLHVVGDATRDEMLLEAGVERAKGLVAVLDTDADNVLVVMTARGLNPNLHIVARAASEEAESKLRRAGADQVVSPYVIGGKRISLAVLRPAVCDFLNAVLYDEELMAEMQELRVDADSALAGKRLTEAGLTHQKGVTPVAIIRERQHLISPPPETVLQPGDTVIVVAPRKV